MSQAAPGFLHVALREHKRLCRQVDTRTHSSAELEALHRTHALSHVLVGSGVPGDAGDVHQDTVDFAVVSYGSAGAAEDRTKPQRVAVKAGRLRLCAVHSLPLGTADARIQQYVLGAGKENEALTWEGTGRLAVQTRWD